MKTLKTLMVAAATVVVFGAAQAANTFAPGKGVANEPAAGNGTVHVAFETRGGGNGYGHGVGRQYRMPIGLTLLAWTVPNDLSFVYGLRANLGFGRYEGTYGVDAGAWSASGEALGLQANFAGNLIERDGAGVQVAAVNLVNGSYSGIQVGVMNRTRHLKGMQIGLMNFNDAGIFFPILNFGF